MLPWRGMELRSKSRLTVAGGLAQWKVLNSSAKAEHRPLCGEPPAVNTAIEAMPDLDHATTIEQLHDPDSPLCILMRELIFSSGD